MKKIKVFVLTIILVIGVSIFAYPIVQNDGSPTPTEKQLALKDKKVKEVIEKGKKVRDKIVGTVVKEVVKAYVTSKIKVKKK